MAAPKDVRSLDLALPKAFRIYDLAAHKFPPNQYWWGPNLLPKSSVLLMAAQPGVGKTLVGLSVTRALTLGVPVFGWDYFDVPRSCSVLYLDQEVAPTMLQDRTTKIFTADELWETRDRFWAISGNSTISFAEAEGMQLILDNVEAVKPEVLVLDPISNFHDGEENNSKDIGKLFRQIGKVLDIGKSWGMSVIIIHHIKKPPSEKDGYDELSFSNVRGSSVFGAVPSSIMMIAKKGPVGTSPRAWKLKARFDKVRNSEMFNDFWLHVNEDGDLRVKFNKVEGSTISNGFPKMDLGHPADGPKAGDLPVGPLHCVTR